MDLWRSISKNISDSTQSDFQITDHTAIGGGCINSAYRVCSAGDEKRFFVKTNQSSLIDMFEAEFAGLAEINDSNSIRAPKPVCVGEHQSTAYIVMEYLDFGSSHSSATSAEQLGQNLADMHKQTQAQFGWYRDNTIGSTPQINDYSNSWVEFYRHNRLGYQFELAARNGFKGRLQSTGDKLMSGLHVFFSEPQPKASLLHGDLWSGNYSMLEDGEPVIFDPATYYGDREADLAMTELFGGFPGRFYAAYKESYPIDSGYQLRKTLYNLYHILNHLNLFGAGYLSQAESMSELLLSEI